MTREECIKVLQALWRYKDCEYSEHEVREALDMAIKALEQEPILDKIMVEIEEEYNNCYICELQEDYDYEENDISDFQRVGSIFDILEIIDKYKAESEV